MSIRETLDKFFDKIGFEIWGLFGAAICVILPFLATIGYVGAHGEPFSILNHFISELGDIINSENAWLFNLGLVISGLLLIPFVIGFALYIDNKIAYLSIPIGVYSVFSISLVGFFPMNYLGPHAVAAMGAFMGGMLTVLVFSLAIAIQKEAKVPKLYSLAGIVVAVIFALFLSSTSSLAADIEDLDMADLFTAMENRPEIWAIPLLEWAVLLSVMAWVALGCVYRIWQKRNERPTP